MPLSNSQILTLTRQISFAVVGLVPVALDSKTERILERSISRILKQTLCVPPSKTS